MSAAACRQHNSLCLQPLLKFDCAVCAVRASHLSSCSRRGGSAGTATGIAEVWYQYEGSPTEATPDAVWPAVRAARQRFVYSPDPL